MACDVIFQIEIDSLDYQMPVDTLFWHMEPFTKGK